MAQKPLTDKQCQEAIDAFNKFDGNKTNAALYLNLPRKTFYNRLDEAMRRAINPQEDGGIGVDGLADQQLEELRTLRIENKRLQRNELTREAIRQEVFKLPGISPEPPKWTWKTKDKTAIGIPTLMLSDWHWGEVVKPSEILGANEFNLAIAHARAERVVEGAIRLTHDFLPGGQYDGIVVCLGGDMVTGDIHEELTATNDAPIMPTFVDLFSNMAGCINELLKKFGNVFVVCVTGNHGRNTKKIQSKERYATNFDWLLYQMLQKHFDGEKRVQFHVPDGPDAYFKIYNHKYMLTHGDQFRGGDGMIGPLGPLTRGRHKKASRDNSLDHQWDTMIVGHFHTLMQLPHLIVNGSLKGLDEYAFQANFGYERPAQALWITHPRQGITFQMPVYADKPGEQESSPWVSWHS